MQGEVRVVDDVPAAFAALVAERAPRLLAISGGGTARRCYQRLAAAELPGHGVDVVVSDERWVPVDHPDSNEGMARAVLLDRLPGRVHSMRQAGPTPDAAAEAYDALLRRLPPPDLCHLGLGEDGHTASLFPGSPALGERARLVVATGDDAHPHPRLTFTYAAIARCHLVVVTVEGPSKADAWRRVRAGDDVPAARVRAGEVVWLVASDVA